MFFETRLTTARVHSATVAGHWRGDVLYERVRRHALRAPAQIAIAATDRWPAVDYRSLLQRADHLALSLLERGVRPGDVVSVQLPNWPEFVLLLLAIERIGAVMNPLTPILRQRELASMLNIASTRALVVPGTFRDYDYAAMAIDLAAQVPSLHFVVAIDAPANPGLVPWSALAGDPEAPVGAASTEWLERLRPDVNQVTELAFTSGTTGQPRGVLHTHNTANSTVGSTGKRQGIDPAAIVHVATPVGHNAGYFFGIRLALQHGATIVLQDVWDGAEMARLIAQHHVTFTMGATAYLIDLLHVPDLERYDLASLAVFMCGGASIPPVVAAEAMQRLPGRLCPVFGMTEHGHSTGTDPHTPLAKVCATDGSPQPEVELRVVDATGQTLPPNVEGRLMLRCPFNFVGYIQGRAFTDQFFDDEDFFDTGDLAYLDEDGFLRITGRAKDLIIRGGENVPVKEVEDLLATFPGVLEVAIVSAPDRRLGERAVACVRLANNMQLSLADVRRFLGEHRVTPQFWPEAVQTVDAFPRTASGKIQKFQLRAAVVSAFDGGRAS